MFQVWVQDRLLPVVSIDCVSCRERNVFTVSRSQHLKLLGNCSNCEGQVSYSWKVHRLNPLEELILDPTTTSTGTNRSNLVILSGALESYANYSVRLDVKAEGYVLKGRSSLVFVYSPPPSGGTCNLTLPQGETLTAPGAVVRVACRDWKDNTNSSSDPVTFHIYIQQVGNPDTWYSVYRGTLEMLDFYVAPFEEDMDGGPILILVDVIDALYNQVTGLNRYMSEGIVHFVQAPVQLQ